MSSRSTLALLLGLVLAGGVLFLFRDMLTQRFNSTPDAPGSPTTPSDIEPDSGDAVNGEREFVDPAALPGGSMDEETAKALFPALRRGRSRKVYDPEAWLLLAPNRKPFMQWAEAESGSITLATNNLGFREDEDTHVEKSGQRILVVGDSHTEGVVNNAQSFANVFERLLGERDGETIDVINAAVGGTGPYNFFGVIKKYAYLKPDVVIATLYSGNDIINALTLSDFFSKRRSPPRGAEYRERLTATTKQWPPVPQGFNQAYYFAFSPEEVPVALQATVDAFTAMHDFCSGQGIRFVALVLPSKPDVDLDGDETVNGILQSLELTRGDFALNLQLAQRAAVILRESGITIIDPTEAMRAEDSPLYWTEDHHLNETGHALVAEVLVEQWPR